MRRILLMTLLAASLAACRKKQGPRPQEPGPSTPRTPDPPAMGLQTGAGVPADEIIAPVVGTEDHTLEYTDAKLMVIIPAGTFDGPTTMTVQKITDSCQGHLKHTYRITASRPLKKAVEVIFDYRFLPLFGADVRTVMIARHRNDKVWYVQENYYSDPLRTRIGIFTKELGDFALMRTLFIHPKDSALYVGTETDVEVKRAIPLRPQPGNGELLAPLQSIPKDSFSKGIPVVQAVPLEREYIYSWNADDLAEIRPIGSMAVCRAFPENPLGVHARIYPMLHPRATTDFTLPISYDLPISGDELQLKVSWSNWLVGPARIFEENGNLVLLQKDPASPVRIMWPLTAAGTGTWNWETPGGQGAWFEWGDVLLGDRAVSRYEVKGETRPSPGSLTITRDGGPGGFVEGHFTLTHAGFYYNGGFRAATGVEGKFRVKRIR